MEVYQLEVAYSLEVVILGETRALSSALMIINMSVSTLIIITSVSTCTVIIVHIMPTFAMPMHSDIIAICLI